MQRVLLTAPYVGEIGWELLSWQGRVRWVFRHGRFDRVVVLGTPGKAAVYADMPGEYRPVDLHAIPGTACEDRRFLEDGKRHMTPDELRSSLAGFVNVTEGELKSAGHEVETLWPTFDSRLWSCDPGQQIFIRLQRPVRNPLPAPWVLLVKRTRAVRAASNWSPENWAELEHRLADQGVNTSAYPNEAEAAIEALSGCDLAVGQSTGGLHLAGLCGCPVVVWAKGESYRASPWEMTDRQRYETLWNPLGTPTHHHVAWEQPEPAEVAAWVTTALAAIGRRTGSSTARAKFHCLWQLRTWLTHRVVRRPSFRRWPWPVQQAIRYGLI